MNREEVLKKIKNIKYPKLDKNIVELKTIDSIEIERDTLKIVLNILNKEAFDTIRSAIDKIFSKDLKNIQSLPVGIVIIITVFWGIIY